MLALLSRVGDIRLVWYLFASVGALAVDMGSFLALLALGLAATPASALGYCLGILAHWILSTRVVSADTAASGGHARIRQKALFVVSAFIGLALTTFIVWTGERAGLDPRLAKVAAIGVSFSATW